MRKLRGNGERVRKWSARQNEREKEFHLCISLSLLQNIKISHFLSQNIEICHFLSQNVKIRHLLLRMSQKNLTYALWENNSESNLLRGSSASYAGLEADSRKESFFRAKDTEDDKCKTKNAFSI